MRLDLHIHTSAYSACSTMTPDQMAAAAKAAGLDGICITEHNRMWDEQEARSLSRKHSLPIFRGMEVTTTGGDILVFGMNEEPAGMWRPAELKARVDAAGGVAIAAHPFRGFLVFGFGTLKMKLDDAIGNPTFSQVHGLEVCNSMATDEENDLAREVAEAMGLLRLGGSDAHRPEAVGTCVTSFEDWIEDEKGLVQAILSGRFTLERLK
jgi:predicted metal-dependent phosphoesterase TrpH